jgi:hypothetical protein
MLLTTERRDIYLPLDECEIPTDARAKLEALGITTVEELRAYWFYDNRELLTEYLGDSPLNVVAMKPPAGAVRGMAAKGGRAGALTCWRQARCLPCGPCRAACCCRHRSG